MGNAQSSDDDDSGYTHRHCCNLSTHTDSFNGHPGGQAQETTRITPGAGLSAERSTGRQQSSSLLSPHPLLFAYLFFTPSGVVVAKKLRGG